MSDFLCYIGNQYKGRDLLNLIKKPYGDNAPCGKSFETSWGAMAVLEEHHAEDKNIIVMNDTIVSWVGDLVLDVSEKYITDLVNRVQELMNDPDTRKDLQSDPVFSRLNGAFAILIADSAKIVVITDMLAFTQVYAGKDRDNNLISFGTHPDLVASLCGISQLDLTSIGEYISQGTTRFPYTMYENVKELDPGSVHIFETKEHQKNIKKYLYWYPPKEIQSSFNKDELVKELRGKFVAAVKNRSNGQRIGVTLSGGLDSRLILAVVPEEKECLGLTFCDYQNRETRLAKKVAHCYKRKWIPVFRKKDFLVDCLKRTVKLQGCESEFFNAHAVGIEKKISDLGLSSILGGMQMDVYFKAFLATDWTCKKKMKGLLPDKYEKNNRDYVNVLSEYDHLIFSDEIINNIIARRQKNYSEYKDLSRGSTNEWLFLYPFSQDKIGACWAAERRVLPVKLVTADRHLLDFAFRCPIELKFGGRIFLEAALSLYGDGAAIPSANDGVRPGSNHFWRLAQRIIRKLEVQVIDILKKLSIEKKVHHSWHDYQRCWRDNKKLRELIRKYSMNLNRFDGILFKNTGREFLENKDFDWHYGFRILQLALWLGIIEEYKNVLKDGSS